MAVWCAPRILETDIKLSEFIIHEMPAILQEWEDFARTIQPYGEQIDATKLRDHAEEMLRAIAIDIDTPQSATEGADKSQGLIKPETGADTAPQTHASTRLAAGYSITQLLAEYRALRASVLRLWTHNNQAAGPLEFEGMLRFNEAIDQAISESVARYSATVHESQNLFLAIIGHDVRTPIGAINMGAEVLLRDASASIKTLKVASRILNSAKRVGDIVRDLLDFATTTTGGDIPITPTRTDLEATCQNLVDEARTFYPEYAISLSTHGDLEITVDEARICQALSNLIANAVQHGGDNTPISVVVRREEAHIVWSIHNEGPTISNAEMEILFDPARRYALATTLSSRALPNRHLGLGLFVSREIIKAHGGSIHAVSSDDDGTTFTVRLPIAA